MDALTDELTENIVTSNRSMAELLLHQAAEQLRQVDGWVYAFSRLQLIHFAEFLRTWSMMSDHSMTSLVAVDGDVLGREQGFYNFSSDISS